MERLTVATLNIWNRSGSWEKRLPLIRQGLMDHEPDIIGLQEVLGLGDHPTLADEIARDLPYRVFNALAGDVGGGLQFGNAILARHEFLDTAHWSLEPSGTEPRGIAYALVRTPAGDVPFFCTHLSWRFHECHERIAQVKEVCKRVSDSAPISGFPAVVVGDFNADPDADEMRMMRGLSPVGDTGVYFSGVWDFLARDNPAMGPGFTFSRENPEALRTREPSRRIDYIFVRGPDKRLRGEPLSARIAWNEGRNGVFPSDHFGVIAELQAAPRKY